MIELFDRVRLITGPSRAVATVYQFAQMRPNLLTTVGVVYIRTHN